MNNTNNDMDMSKFPAETPLAMCYVPFQSYGEVYTENKALERGTVFPNLDFPFEGMEVSGNESK
ncbi:MAG: spore coat associated protein CotJA [Oscillospiraceae bacterium]|nr:spore coat associated protein CotJA [Oscillospiraceae bacterium]